MESIEAEVCVESVKSDRQGRRIRGADEWSLILKRYNQSGLTQAAFCAREGLRFERLWHGWGVVVRTEVRQVNQSCRSQSSMN
jgi:hypothetical protein